MLTLSQTRFPQKLFDYITLYFRALSARKIIRILSVILEKIFLYGVIVEKKSQDVIVEKVYFQGVIVEKVYFQGVILEKFIFRALS